MSDITPDALPYEPYLATATMVLADTEYDIQLPEGTRRFMVHTRDESEFRLAFETGRVAGPVNPYLTVLANTRYYSYEVNLRVTNAAWDGTLYFASSSAGKIIEVHYWLTEVV